MSIEQTGDYPWDGTIGWTIANGSDHALRFGVRIPAWSDGARTLLVDGSPNTTAPEDGIVYVTVDAHSDMTVTLELPMEAKLVRASNRVKETVGQVALMRGPIVYCAESCDNPGPLWLYTVNPGEAASAEHDEGLLGGVTVVRQPAWRQPEDPETQPLYVPATPRPREACEVTMVPYYTWANRDEGQMRVWLPCAPYEADTNR
ncbi:beta-L-arabinofuranosidase domain-containing protein [Bifidobacterium magnum]|uniref:beta-L-arabinofuranosidase domain-containing protein n=1 Tax=Bifidobacterium magnum TaxID=1692 RepID=UPI0009DBF3C2